MFRDRALPRRRSGGDILRLRVDPCARQQADQSDKYRPSQIQPPALDPIVRPRKARVNVARLWRPDGGAPASTGNSGIPAGQFPLSVWVASGTIIALRKDSAPNHAFGATDRGEHVPERYAHAAVHRAGGTSWAPALSAHAFSRHHV